MIRNRKVILLLALAIAAVATLLFLVAPTDTPEPGAAIQSPPDPNTAHPPPTSAAPGITAAEFARSLPPDSPTSPHPVERAVAEGTVLDSRIEPLATNTRWQRTRLVRTNVQDRLVRVVETWEIDPSGTQPAWNLRRDMYLADQLILKPARGLDEQTLRDQLQLAGMRIENRISDELFTIRLSKADLDAVPDGLNFLKEHPELAEFAEADGVGFGGGIPNDSSFTTQWGLHNTGQSGGVIDADVDGPEFWDIISGAPGIVIAVLDSGLNFTHPDLQGIEWVNPGETPGDSIDNDLSGKIDDVNGWDFVNNDNNPADDHGHGSNVTGIITANRNNSTGIAGMISDVEILVCKILNSSNSGLTSNLIAATTYARQRGVPIMNLSLQNYPFSSTLNTEFTACQSAGILLSICCGNQGVDNDTTPNYPSSYPHSNILCVGNHQRTDVRWSGSFNPSNYGALAVDIFAPGRQILSPILETSYSSYTGSSQAAPFATAVCAAIKFANPQWEAPEIKNCIISSVITKAAYNGICTSGGRLNAVSAVSHAFRQLPLEDTDDDGFSNLFEYYAGTRIDLESDRPAIQSGTAGGFLTIGTSRVARPDGSLEVEGSTDLDHWTAMGVTDFSTPGTLLGGISISGSPRGFLRIRAAPMP